MEPTAILLVILLLTNAAWSVKKHGINGFQVEDVFTAMGISVNYFVGKDDDE